MLWLWRWGKGVVLLKLAWIDRERRRPMLRLGRRDVGLRLDLSELRRVGRGRHLLLKSRRGHLMSSLDL